MKTKDILIIGLLTILVISFFWKGTDWMDSYIKNITNSDKYRDKVESAERWRARTVLEYKIYKDSVEVNNKLYLDSISYQIAYRDNQIEILKEKKKDRLNASDDELIQELHSRISNTGTNGIYKLTSNGVNYVLEVLDEKESYAIANYSLQMQISYLNSINTEDKATIKQLESILTEGNLKFKDCNQDLIDYTHKYDNLYNDYLLLKDKNKKKGKVIFALVGVVVLETLLILTLN